ncbi:MAG: hypothetical protein VKK04_12630 [Synechococcales bacterium]|nr:hypothetical protein [Synechococcales bacterium]
MIPKKAFWGLIGAIATGCIWVNWGAIAWADYQSFVLSPGFEPDPQVGTGYSGGPRQTADCGFVGPSNTPDHVLQLLEPFSFLHALVEAPGDVTLLIEGPDGRRCVDDADGNLPEVVGGWSAGTYQIWIGDWERAGYRYSLYLSEYSR